MLSETKVDVASYMLCLNVLDALGNGGAEKDDFLKPQKKQQSAEGRTSSRLSL